MSQKRVKIGFNPLLITIGLKFTFTITIGEKVTFGHPWLCVLFVSTHIYFFALMSVKKWLLYSQISWIFNFNLWVQIACFLHSWVQKLSYMCVLMSKNKAMCTCEWIKLSMCTFFLLDIWRDIWRVIWPDIWRVIWRDIWHMTWHMTWMDRT